MATECKDIKLTDDHLIRIIDGKIKQIPYDNIIGLKEKQDKLKLYYVKQSQISRLKKISIISCNEEIRRHIEKSINLRRQHRPQRLLIFVNPFGGKGRAFSLYKKIVRPLLDLAQVQVKLVVTKYANHARDTIEDQEFELECFDGIVCVGGDGMFSELMNGLLFRCNRHKLHYQASSPSLGGFIGQPFLSPSIPVGVIGAGSTDANSFGLIGTNDVITATLNIILGNQIKVDVCSIHSIENDKLLRFVSTFAAYGYFGDVIRESEKLRWLGPSRYDLTGFSSLLKNRTYRGHLRIFVSDQDGTPFDHERCHRNCKLCLDQVATSEDSDSSKFESDSNTNSQHRKDADLRLIEIQGAFVGVNAAVTACRCPQTRKGFSPGNHLANGCADLIIVRPCSRLQYIKYLLRTGWTKKSAFDLKYVDAYRCREFEFIAEQDHTSCSSASSVDHSSNSSVSTTSSWNVDGEILNEYSIRVKVNNQLLRVFGTGEPEM